MFGTVNPSQSPTTIPSIPSQPVTVQIISSAQIGRCDNLRVDLTGSTGHAGRAWKWMNVSVIGGFPEAAVSLQQQLQSSLTTMTPLVISRDKLQSSLFAYKITVVLCNIFDSCGTGLVKVNVTDSTDATIAVNIVGQSERSMTRSASLSLISTASVSTCAGSQNASSSSVSSSQGLDIKWQVIEFDTGLVLTDVQSSSKDKMKFVLPAYSLQTRTVYGVQVTASDVALGVSATAFVKVTVVQSSIVVSLSTRSGVMLLRVGDSPVEVNGLSTYDPDVSSGSGTQSESDLTSLFDFEWTCMVSNTTTITDLCFVTIVQSGPRAYVSAMNQSAIGSISTIALKVSDRSPPFPRHSSAYLQVKVIAGDAPLVTIATAASDVSKVNVKNRVVLSGTVSSKTSCKASWSSDSGMDLNAIAIAAYSKYVAASVETSVSLVLMSYGLPAVQASYAFSLSCGSSSSSIVVSTNGAPTGGSYSVQPREEEELSTLFSMTATQWVDVDLPLSYQFGYLTVSSSGSAEYTTLTMVVRSRMETSYASSVFPAGPQSTGNILNSTVTVYDVYDAYSSTSWSVKVKPMVVSNLQSLITSKLTSVSSVNGSSLTVEELKQLVSVSSSALNRVNCTNAPNCASLNRYGCATKDNTCGRCMSGFVVMKARVTIAVSRPPHC